MRAFLGIPANEEVKELCQKIIQELMGAGVKAKFVEPQNLHITVRFLGELCEAELECVKEEVSHVNAAPFDIEMQGLGAYPNEKHVRVLWVSVGSGREKLGALLGSLGGRDPHITIARVAAPHPAIGEMLASLKNAQLGYMRVDEIVLFKSELTSKGPIYTALWRRAL